MRRRAEPTCRIEEASPHRCVLPDYRQGHRFRTRFWMESGTKVRCECGQLWELVYDWEEGYGGLWLRDYEWAPRATMDR